MYAREKIVRVCVFERERAKERERERERECVCVCECVLFERNLCPFSSG